MRGFLGFGGGRTKGDITAVLSPFMMRTALSAAAIAVRQASAPPLRVRQSQMWFAKAQIRCATAMIFGSLMTRRPSGK